MEKFLQDIVLFINEARGEKKEDILQKQAEEILCYYIVEKNKGTFYDNLERTLGHDLELYYLVLFTIQFISPDAESISVMEKLLMRPELDLLVAENIYSQLANIRFRDHRIKQSYVEGRQINHFLLRRYEQEYPLPVPYLTYVERNKRRIVIETDTLLQIEHAPTQIVLDACRVLQGELGYEVFLVVNVIGTELDWMNRFCLFPYISNYRTDMNGVFSLEYEGVNIRGYQLLWNQNASGQMQQLLTELYDWKPLCVWHIGGSSLRHDIYRKLTTLLSMPCTDGYSVSEAQVLVSYMQSNSPSIAQAVTYAEQQGQKCLNIKRMDEQKEMGTNRSRNEFQIPEDAFVITIVGNRLDAEMSKEFIQMLLELEQQIDKLYFLIIGPCERKPFQTKDKNKVKYVGFCKDLTDMMKLADLFVNPPRQGGGGGAARALALGIPVVTLPDCDVFNTAGEDFSCQNVTEMKEKILRYTQDADFYKSHQSKARQKWEAWQQVDNKTSYREMLQQIEDWLQKGEIA